MNVLNHLTSVFVLGGFILITCCKARKRD